MSSQVTQSPLVRHSGVGALLLFFVFIILLSLSPMPLKAAQGRRTIDDVLDQYGQKVRLRLKPRFDFANVAWPPKRVTLVAFKDTRLMELWAFQRGDWHHIKDYRIKGMSGRRGPKLREGDRQVPEGSYGIELLNPNSAYHLSLKLNYPNRFDRRQAEADGRHNLGGDIFIHGGHLSKGCLAVGNVASEELFVLTALIGESNVSVLIAPKDFRFRPQRPIEEDAPPWVADLNDRIAIRLLQFPLEDKL